MLLGPNGGLLTHGVRFISVEVMIALGSLRSVPGVYMSSGAFSTFSLPFLLTEFFVAQNYHWSLLDSELTDTA